MANWRNASLVRSGRRLYRRGRGFLRSSTQRLHDTLTGRVSLYRRWHRNPHHRRAHLGALTVYSLVVLISMMSALAPVGLGGSVARASSRNWAMASAGDYSFDNAKVELIDGVASLKKGFTPGTNWIATDAGQDWAYRQAITVTNPNASDQTNKVVTLDEGLSGKWSFNSDSGSIVIDDSGRSQAGTSSAALVSGKFGQARNLTSASEKISIPIASGVSTPLSISFWFKPTLLGSDQNLVALNGSGSYPNVTLTSTNKITVWSGSTPRRISTKTFAAGDLNQWWHVAVTIDDLTNSANWKIYINGAENMTASTYTSASFSYPATAYQFGGGSFVGALDEIRVYRRALSAADTSSLYNNNTPAAYGSLYALGQADTDDIRFTDSDGVTPLTYVISSGALTQESLQANVLIPTIAASSSKTIYMYYGNPTTGTTENAAAVYQHMAAVSTYLTHTIAGTGHNPLYTDISSSTWADANRDAFDSYGTTQIYPSTNLTGTPGVVNIVPPENSGDRIQTLIVNGRTFYVYKDMPRNQNNAPSFLRIVIFPSDSQAYSVKQSGNLGSDGSTVTGTTAFTSGGTNLTYYYSHDGAVPGQGDPNVFYFSAAANAGNTYGMTFATDSPTSNLQNVTGPSVVLVGPTDNALNDANMSTFFAEEYAQLVAYVDTVWTLSGTTLYGQPTGVSGLASSVSTTLDYLYPTSATIASAAAVNYISISGFTATMPEASRTSVKFQLSNNGGSTWLWWDGAAWSSATDTATQSSLAADINAHVATLPEINHIDQLIWRAYLVSSGYNDVELSGVAVDYALDAVAPPNPNPASVTVRSGSTDLNLANWQSVTAPVFTWTEPTDTADTGAGEVVAGVDGYWVYLGTDNTADPKTAGTYQASATYTGSLSTSGTYYLRVRTKDRDGNYSAAGTTLATYKFDGQAPTSPGFVSVSPLGYSSQNSYTFIWPTVGTGLAADQANLSGLAGYQYKTGAESGQYSSWSNTITDGQITISDIAYLEGANIFYLRSVDNAGNGSNPIFVQYYFAGNAPTAPRNLTAQPATSANSPSTSNSFSFTWDEPESVNGSIKSYYYSINTPPTVANVTAITTRSLAAGSYATQQGKNTLYVVAQDEAGNINYDLAAQVDFYAVTPAPGVPTGLQAFDVSNRLNQQFATSLTWVAPTYRGTGFAGYDIYRSTGGAAFSRVGAAAGTSYIDTDLESKEYSYYVLSRDNAGQYSVASTTVSLTPTGRFTIPPNLTEEPTVATKSFSAVVSWETDRKSSSFVEYGTDKDHLGKANGGKTIGELEQSVKHAVTLEGLEPETIYYYQAVWVDDDGNDGRSEVMSFETGLRPKISDVKVSNITLSSATISWTSTTIATSSLKYGPSSAYGAVREDGSSSQTTTHTLVLTDLLDSTTYHFQVTGTDSDNNALTSDDYVFQTLIRPRISNVRFESVKDAATTTLRFTWDTNTPTTTIVTYRLANGQGVSRSASTADYVTAHDIKVPDLADQSTYILQVKGVDSYGNEAISDAQTFTTPDDTRPPKISNLQIKIRSSGFSLSQKAQMSISWETDEPASSVVEYGPGLTTDSYPLKTQEDGSLTTTHMVIVSELDPAKLYHLRAVSYDAARNLGSSPDTTVITGKIQQSVLDVVMNTLERSLSFLTNFKFWK